MITDLSSTAHKRKLFFIIIFECIYLTPSRWRHIENGIVAVHTTILWFAYYCFTLPTYVGYCRTHYFTFIGRYPDWTNDDFGGMGVVYFVIFFFVFVFVFFINIIVTVIIFDKARFLLTDV